MIQNPHFNFVAIPQEVWQQMQEKQDRIEALILNRNRREANASWVESEEARKMLGVCPRTWQNMRDNRVIPFSQFGRKIWVRRSDIDNFIKSNLITKGGTKDE